MQRDIYYVADNMRKDLYAYLLVVKTMKKKSAGTTSNICVKISGSKTDSKVSFGMN